jgi:hypothetical protein
VADPLELIVSFKRGVSEDDARQAVGRAGAEVRRRMRADHADEVMLLVKIGTAALESVEEKLKREACVARTERNSGGFRPM